MRVADGSRFYMLPELTQQHAKPKQRECALSMAMQYSFFNLDPWWDPVRNKVEAGVAAMRLLAAEVCGSIWLERMWMRREPYLHGPPGVQLVNTDPIGGCQLDAAGPSDFTALHELMVSFILVTVAGWFWPADFEPGDRHSCPMWNPNQQWLIST